MEFISEFTGQGPGCHTVLFAPLHLPRKIQVPLKFSVSTISGAQSRSFAGPVSPLPDAAVVSDILARHSAGKFKCLD